MDTGVTSTGQVICRPWDRLRDNQTTEMEEKRASRCKSIGAEHETEHDWDLPEMPTNHHSDQGVPCLPQGRTEQCLDRAICERWQEDIVGNDRATAQGKDENA